MSVQAIFLTEGNAKLNLGDTQFSGLIRDLIIERSIQGLPTRLVDTDHDRKVSVDVIVPANTWLQFESTVDASGDDTFEDNGSRSKAEVDRVTTDMRNMAETSGMVICPGLVSSVSQANQQG